jgi:hypothetical protein
VHLVVLIANYPFKEYPRGCVDDVKQTKNQQSFLSHREGFFSRFEGFPAFLGGGGFYDCQKKEDEISRMLMQVNNSIL